LARTEDLGPLTNFNTKVRVSTKKDILDFQYLTRKGQRVIMEEALDLWEDQKLTQEQKDKLKDLRRLRT